MKKIYFLWSLLGLLTINIGCAQNNITGTVLDETGAPLPGATVIVEGTTRGVATDFDGNFSIQASQGDILLISYVGYTDQRITINNQDNYVINLSPDNELEEVIITGVSTDPMPSFQHIENRLNMADALIRLNMPGAATIINESRVNTGGLTPASDGNTDLLDKLFYERYLEVY